MPGLVVLELRPPREYPRDRYVHWDPEVEREVRLRGVAVDLPDPARVAAADDVPRVGGEDVPVGQDEVPGLEERQDVPLVPVGEVCRVEQAERGRREQALLLAPRSYLLDRLGGVPLRLEDLEVLVPEPLLEEVELRRLSGAVDALDGDEPSRLWVDGGGRSASSSCSAAALALTVARRRLPRPFPARFVWSIMMKSSLQLHGGQLPLLDDRVVYVHLKLISDRGDGARQELLGVDAADGDLHLDRPS